MAITISVSSLVVWSLVALVLYALYRLYDLFVIQPRVFAAFWEAQGVRGRPYKFPLGQLPEIQAAADADRIVEYASGMAREFGLFQTQIVGPICHCVVYDPEVVKVSFESRARADALRSEQSEKAVRSACSRLLSSFFLPPCLSLSAHHDLEGSILSQGL